MLQPNERDIEIMDKILIFRRDKGKDMYFRDYKDAFLIEVGIDKKRYQIYINEISKFSDRDNPTICHTYNPFNDDDYPEFDCNDYTDKFIEDGGFKNYYGIKTPKELSLKESTKRILTMDDKDRLLNFLVDNCNIGEYYGITNYEPILQGTNLTDKELHALFTQFNQKGLIEYEGNIHYGNKVVNFTVLQSAVDFKLEGGFKGEKERSLTKENSPSNGQSVITQHIHIEGDGNIFKPMYQSTDRSENSQTIKSITPDKVKKKPVIQRTIAKIIIGVIIMIIGTIILKHFNLV